MAPVLERRLQRLIDQPTAKARAIDEQIARNTASVRQDDGVDIARRAIQDMIDDPPFGADHAASARHLAQEGGVEAGVELKGVAEGGQHGAGVGNRPLEPVRLGRPDRIAVVADVGSVAHGAARGPDMVEIDPLDRLAISTEGMDIAVAGPPPVHELDAQFEGGLSLVDQRLFVDAHGRVEGADVGQGGLAHADDADLVGLDQFDRDGAARQTMRQGGGRHPASGSSAQDDDFSDRTGIVLDHHADCLADHFSA